MTLTARRFGALLAPLLAALFLLTPLARADALPLGGEAPYPPVQSAFTADGMGYDDGTLKVSIETDVAYNTNVYYVYVTLTDPSQLRTALAKGPRSKATRPVWSMAQQHNAVLAINGDYFSYQNSGVIVRGGEIIRERPVATRDTLDIDQNRDMQFLTKNDLQEWRAFKESGTVIREAFSFGPALVIDGAATAFNHAEKTSCGAPTPAQRIVLCQLAPLRYLIFACEGPEQDKKAGLTIKQVVELLLAKGVRSAYNLDGGSSVTIWLGGRRINAPESKDRAVSDIIYFATTLKQP